MLSDVFKSLQHIGMKSRFVRDELVGGHCQDAGFGASACYVPCGSDGGRTRRESDGFKQELCVGEAGELLMGQGSIFFAGADIDVFRRNDGRNALEGELQQGFSHAEEVNELLRALLPADGPEAFSDASCQDDTEIIAFHSFGDKNVVRPVRASGVARRPAPPSGVDT